MRPSLRMPLQDAAALVRQARSLVEMARIVQEIAEVSFQLGYQLGSNPQPKLREIAPGIMAMELESAADLAAVLDSLEPEAITPRKPTKIGFI